MKNQAWNLPFSYIESWKFTILLQAFIPLTEVSLLDIHWDVLYMYITSSAIIQIVQPVLLLSRFRGGSKKRLVYKHSTVFETELELIRIIEY